jgi:hypothetical protein
MHLANEPPNGLMLKSFLVDYDGKVLMLPPMGVGGDSVLLRVVNISVQLKLLIALDFIPFFNV